MFYRWLEELAHDAKSLIAETVSFWQLFFLCCLKVNIKYCIHDIYIYYIVCEPILSDIYKSPDKSILFKKATQNSLV